jgi:membrane protease YdiL (CAAX protease family)
MTEFSPFLGQLWRTEWLLYLAALVTAELVISLGSAALGLTLHILLMFTLLFRASFAPLRERALLTALVLAPLIRIVSLALPLNGLPTTYWHVLISIPLFTACILWIRSLQLSRYQLGLRLSHGLRAQLLIGFLGYPLGGVEFLILRPTASTNASTTGAIVLLVAILLICTGFLEELIFRGILQAAALRLFGRSGLVYVSGVFAALHIGYLSLVDVVFVFGVGVLFGWLVLKTGSLLGVSIAHGMTNVLLLLVLPTFPFPPHVP